MKKRFVLALAVFTLFYLSGYTSFFSVIHFGNERLMRSVFGDNANSASDDNRAYFTKQFGLSLGNIYWGEFHCHTNYSIDAAVCSANSPDKAYEYARDQTELDFVALSDHAEDAIALWNALDGYRPSGEGEEGTALTVVHTPANVSEKEDDALDHRTDWRYMDQDFVRHVEIYSKWGYCLPFKRMETTFSWVSRVATTALCGYARWQVITLKNWRSLLTAV